jgi:heme-degrading monooxygenase HmoA
MVRLVAIFTVRDVGDFLRFFAEGESRRASQGVLGHSVHRAVDNPNEVMVTVELESRRAAEALLLADERLRAWMDRAGVELYPAIFIGEPIDAAAPAS